MPGRVKGPLLQRHIETRNRRRKSPENVQGILVTLWLRF